MRMGRVAEVLPQSAQVLSLVPSAATRSAAEHATSTHHPSYLQADHLATRLRLDADQHGLWLGASWLVPDPVDLDALARAFTRYVGRHGVMQGWFEVDPQDPQQVVRKDLSPDEIDFGWDELGSADGANLRDLVLTSLRRGCDPLEPFGYACLLVRGDDGNRVILATDHSYSDAFTLFLAQWEIASLYDEETGVEQAALPPVGDYREHADAERAEGATQTLAHPAVAKWGRFWQSGGDLGRFPVDIGVEPGDDYRLEPFFQEIVTEKEAQVIEARAKENGANLVTALYAACALAARDLAGATSYRFVNPVHTRTGMEWLAAAGWFVGLVPVHVDLGPDDDIWEVARRVRAEFAANRDITDLPYLRAYELITEAAGQQVGNAGGRHLFSYLDTRPVPGVDRWADRGVVLVTDDGRDSNVATWVFRGPDMMRMVTIGPDDPDAQAEIARYYEHARDILRALLTG